VRGYIFMSPKMTENRTFEEHVVTEYEEERVGVGGRGTRGEGEDESYTRHHVPKHYSVRLEKQN